MNSFCEFIAGEIKSIMHKTGNEFNYLWRNVRSQVKARIKYHMMRASLLNMRYVDLFSLSGPGPSTWPPTQQATYTFGSLKLRTMAA